MFLAFLGERGRHGEAFLFNSGRVTLASYGLAPLMRGEEARVKLPAAHPDLLRRLELRHGDGPILFVHAGISPIRALADQDEEDLLWIRDDFLLSKEDFGKFVVHGHTPVPKPDFRSNRINIDTGAYATGVLTLLTIQGEQMLTI